MKTMTCQDLGGPCALAHSADSADAIIKAQDKHVKDAVKGGDTTHAAARAEMKGRWLHPKQSMGWYNDVKARYAALPEE